MTRKWKVALVGATGAVGRELRSILAERNFPVGEFVPFASPRSQGKPVSLGDRKFDSRVLAPGCFSGVDLAFFDASDAVSKEWVPEAARAGAWVVDNSATFRLEQDIPLVVPEINGAHLERAVARGRASLSERERIFSGPNCSTVQLVLPLQVIQRGWGLKRVVVSSYQSTSGAGAAAMDELSLQTVEVLRQDQITPRAFPHRIAFNCIPQIGSFQNDGYTSEERKIIAESRKILGLPGLRITATAVRVPTFSSHGESVSVECEKPFDLGEVRRALGLQAGIVVQDDPARGIYPMSATSPGDGVEAATGRDAVYVGRLRRDESVDNGLNLWVVSDNLRKGAALNAIQIGEALFKASV